MLRKSYLSVAKLSRTEFEEKRSKFITTVKPVDSEADAIAFLNAVRSEFRLANHNVYAYYTSNPVRCKRFSDDGEPQGTAGKPILNVIEKSNLEDIAIVVTRYFGGTLLGAAGLTRAYGRAASMGTEEAGVVKYTLCDDIHIMTSYPMYNIIKNEIDKSGIFVKNLEYGLDVELIVQAEAGISADFIKNVMDLTSGAAIIEKAGISYSIV